MSISSRAGSPDAIGTVRVGTLNAPKLEAVRLAFAPYFKDARVCGHAVESGVSEQPVGFSEIVLGARNRAREARGAGACDLGVGIEDGLVEFAELGGEVLNVGAAVVTDGRREGLGFTSLFAYPPACVESALASRDPIGGLFDAFWRAHKGAASTGPSGSSVGNIGLLSQGVLPRSEYGRHAVVCALVRFLHPELYPVASGGHERSVENERSGVGPRVSGSG